MRVEPFGVGSVVHVVKRGARGMDIVRDESDRWRFVRSIFLLNDSYQTAHRHDHNHCIPMHKSDLCIESAGPTRFDGTLFVRPEWWPERDPLVSVLAWVLMSNHFHLLLYERRHGGVSKFMQRLCGSMSTTFNQKYDEKGSLFQGSYKSRTVDSEEYLRYVHAYIVVKNVFELYPRKTKSTPVNFDDGWRWARSYPFSSFQTSALWKPSPVIDMETFTSLGLSDKNFKRNAQDMLNGHLLSHDESRSLILEEW